MMGTPPPVSRLADSIADYDARVAALIADDDDLVTYVSRLEEMVDEMDDEDDEDDDDFDDEIDDDPELLAAEVEQFLRERTGDD